MTFNSYVFIMAFLPACLAGYFLLNYFGNYRSGLAFLLGMSLWFYGYFNLNYLPIICVSVLVNYAVYCLLHGTAITEKNEYATELQDRKRKMVFIIGLSFNLGLLGYFKYMDFFIENVNLIFHTDFPLKHILLPLGISFFTFQQISFLVDVYRDKQGTIKYSFLDYASYVTYFPQLVAGPIVTHDVLVPQLQDENRKRINYDSLAKGITLFAFGLAEKVLLADVFGSYVNQAYGDLNALNTTTAFFTMLAYTLQIYFDFSGYSDMAVGLGWMMNVDLPMNFNSPYRATSVTEFWKRWHITLTAFFTKYVYIPLGGNRKGHVGTYTNIFIVFLLSGLWHGAGWTFILWGGTHGVAQIFERIYSRFCKIDKRTVNNPLDTVGERVGTVLTWKAQLPSPYVALRWLVTFGFVNIAWVIFRADNMTDVYVFFSKLLSFDFGYSNAKMVRYFIVSMAMILLLPHVQRIAGKCVAKRYTPFAVAALLTWCIFSFAGVSVFIYFNF